jgi:hypothetical protein
MYVLAQEIIVSTDQITIPEKKFTILHLSVLSILLFRLKDTRNGKKKKIRRSFEQYLLWIPFIFTITVSGGQYTYDQILLTVPRGHLPHPFLSHRISHNRSILMIQNFSHNR